MSVQRVALVLAWFLLASGQWASGDTAVAEFRDEATALPFPPDARELTFTTWTERIKYKSQSPLKSLAAFYLQEMAKRGWEHDASEVEIEDDSIKLLFRHGEAEVELDLSQRSKAIHVSLDTDGLDFAGVDDPAKLATAGLSMPRAVLFMQREVKYPGDIKDLEYEEDGVSFKSSLKLQAAFDNLTQQIKAKGFRESRRPIITDDRRYTEFQKGPIELSVNIFSHAFGSRAILDYENDQPEPRLPALPAVASLPISNPGESAESASDDLAETPPARTPINVTNNRGSASVTYGNRKYTFKHVACFQTKDRGDYATEVVFAEQPIPLNKMQALVASKDDFSFGDLFEFNYPRNLILQVGKYQNLTFSADGTGIGGYDLENATGELKVEVGRVVGTLTMPPKEILSRPLSFSVTIDAAIITPNTRFSSGTEDPVEKTNNPILADSPVPMPAGVEDLSRQGSNFRKVYNATVTMPVTEVADFYRKELTASGWKRTDASAASESVSFSNATQELSVQFKQQQGQTAIEVIVREAAVAKRQGIMPDPGKGRLVLANSHTKPIVYTIGKTNYPLKAGQGGKDFKRALNYSLAPGIYNVVVKIPGEQPQTERIELTAGSTWAVIALPTGGYLPMQMY